ncbi:MAG: cytochrome c biogenesis protein CcsA [Chlorobi bacterium]|nr:cytochrome c biogenesis protein CcsA [Chlorobiota bacterium]
MISIINNFLETILPIAYALVTLAYGLAFVRDDAYAAGWRTRLLIFTLVTHFFYIGTHTAEYARCMVTTPFEIMSLIAFTITATYAYIEHRTKSRETGFFMLFVAFMFVVVSSVMTRMPSVPNPVLEDNTVGIHVSTAIFGYGALAISAVYSFLFLILYRNIRRNTFGPFFKHLPSLESLEKLSVVAAAIGLTFLTVAMLVALIWLPDAIPNFSYADPKLVITALVWLLYAAVLLFYYVFKIDSRRIMQLSVSGFLLALFSMTVINLFFSTFHRFI